MTDRKEITPVTDRILDKLILFALIAQIVFIFGMNLFRADTIIDFDSSSAYLHEMEMGSQGKIFPSEYSYQATMDLDSAAMMSALLYHFTGDIFLSRGIANNLMVLLYIYVVHCILNHLALSARWKRFGILLFLIPYSMIMLGYWRMLFVGGGFFAVRALVPLLLISLIPDLDKGSRFRHYAFRLLLLLFFVFLGGLSSGAYLLLCAVFPFLLWEFVRAFLKGDYSQVRSKRTGIATLAVLASVAGLILQKAVGFSSTADSKRILTSSKWAEAVLSSFAGLFELFGGLTTHEQVKLFSAEAIGTAVDFAVTFVLLTAILYTVVTCVKKKEISDMKGYILSLMLVNALMCSFLDLKYGVTVFESRYHIVPMLPSFFLVVMMMEDLSKKDLKKVQLYTLHCLITGLFLASMLYGDAQWVYAKTALESDKLVALDRVIEEEGISTAFIVGEDSKELGRKIRVYGKNTHYIVLNDGAESAFRTIWGGTTRYLDHSMHTGKAAIIATQMAYDTLPPYLVAGMNYLRDYDDLLIYVSDKSRFDCVSGPVAGKDCVVDFPYSPGYTYDHAGIDDDGFLVMNAGGGMLESTYTGADGTWDYTVFYEMTNEGGETSPDNEQTKAGGESCVEICVGDNAPARAELDPAADSVTVRHIVMSGGETVRFAIHAPQGTGIKRIEIRRSR